jgi:purine catabolism regulator
MSTVTEIVHEWALAGIVEGQAVLAGDPNREVVSVQLLESLDGVEALARGALLLLTARASEEAQGYRLDVLLRKASNAGHAAIVLTLPPAGLSVTARALADRTGVAITAAPTGVDRASALLHASRLLEGDVTSDLERARRFLEAVDQLSTAEADSSTVLALAQRHLDRMPKLSAQSSQDAVSVPSAVVGSKDEWLVLEPMGGAADVVARLALWRAAAAITAHDLETERAQQLLLLSAGDLLDELLDSDPNRTRELSRRGTELGLPITGWHAIICVEVENSLALVAGGEAAAYALRDELSRRALDAASQARRDRWNFVREGEAVLLVWSGRQDPGLSLGIDFEAVAEQVLRSLLRWNPELRLHIGIGTAHEAVPGLRASRAEAMGALAAARTKRRVNAITTFDKVGIQRALMEWYAASTVRDSVDRLLAPLDALGPKGAVMIDTLRIYLDTNSSLARTAQLLHVHRNTVTYRMERIGELLDLELDDADQRLMLHLACRARAIS